MVTDASRDVCSADPTETATNQIAVLIKDIHKVMLLCNHAIYRSQAYGRPDGATYTYVRMMDVCSYLHKLLTNDHLRDGVMRHFHMLEKFLAHPACEIIKQLKFNTDHIEVSNGFCFLILQRRFIISPIAPSMYGKSRPEPTFPTTVRLHHSPATSEMPYSIHLKTLSPESISSTSFTSVCSPRRCRTK